MNNLLDQNGEHNFLFLASVIAVLFESHPITLDLTDINGFWGGDIIRLQYDLAASQDGSSGSITFSLKDKLK